MYSLTHRSKFAGLSTLGIEKGEEPDLICRIEQPRAQTSLAGLADFPTATSGARKPGGVPSVFLGGAEVKNA